MPRTWCPALSDDAQVQIHTMHLHDKVADPMFSLELCSRKKAKENGAVGFESGASAKELGTELTRRIGSSIPKFSPYVVASRANISQWQISETPSLIPILYGKISFIAQTEDENDIMGPGEIPLVVHHVSHIWKAHAQLDMLPSVQLPSDQTVEFITHIMRTETERKKYSISDSMRKIILTPSPSASTYLSDVLEALVANRRMIEHLRSLVLAGEFLENMDHLEFQEFFEAALQLVVLGVPYTFLSNVAVNFLPLLKASMIKVLDLEGNDLGISADGNDIITLLAEYIKENKFLLELNLSYNNIGTEGARMLLEALSASDTKITPQDLQTGEYAESEENIEEPRLENLSFFLPDVDDDDEEEEEEGEGEDEVEEEYDNNEGEGDSGKKKDNDARGKTDVPHDADNDDDEEEEEEEEGDDEQKLQESDDDDADEEDGEEEEEDEEEKEKDRLPPHLLEKFRRLFRRLHREEKKARIICIQTCLDDSDVIVKEHNAIKARLAEEKRLKIENYCQRRSGWSHLQVLRLRGNPIDNGGATSVAAVLRHEIVLEEEDIQRIQNELTEKADNLLNILLSERKKTVMEESSERRRLFLEYHTSKRLLNDGLSVKLAQEKSSALKNEKSSLSRKNNNVEDDSDENNGEIEGIDDYDGDNNIKGAPVIISDTIQEDDFVNIADEIAEEESLLLEEARGNWDMPFPPTKQGLQSLRLLDLGSCHIGSLGAKCIGEKLRENKSLEVLLMRHNTFARKRVALVSDKEGVEEEPVSAKRVDVPHYVSPGCVSLFGALESNTTLTVLDLAYNSLYPESIRCLAKSLETNKTLTTLSLEGNLMGFNESPYEMDPAFLKATGYPVDASVFTRPSCFLTLLQAVFESNITTLLLGHNDLYHCWSNHEAEWLTKVCCRLHVLHLNGNSLTSEHIMDWVDASTDSESFTLKELQLSRNDLSGENGGNALARLLDRCKDTLENLILDETKLGVSGATTAFASFTPSTLQFLSIRNAGLTLASAIPRPVLAPLHRLLISDNPFSTTELLDLMNILRSTATALTHLSIWSREVEMELQLPVLQGIVRQMPQLLFVDFGIISRFDDAVDAEDSLGQIECVLVERRLARLLERTEACTS
ncbi:Leucine-rich repeat [Trypanosoma melophagium]|uniref:Leucine-rich repeat n=1 Tax=Trypanosoma melophagium TaxID=715481 RepID=UPI00351A3D98|nr:Leucine-rich repeat [Trypanosoma melophagium]